MRIVKPRRKSKATSPAAAKHDSRTVASAAAFAQMNSPQPNTDDSKLRALLREAHPSPELPPRFQEGVWQRLERAGRRHQETASVGLIERLVRGLFRPAFATGGLVAAMFAGVWLGVREGETRLRRVEQSHYVAAVSPFYDREIP